METNKELVELIKFITKYLVDSPDDIKINEIPGGHTTVLELTVAKDDIGKVIGKKGNTAKSVRTILSAVAAKYNKKAILEIIE